MTRADHIKKIGFVMGFSVLILLLFLLGNVFLNWYLMGLMGFVILLFILKTAKPIKKISKNETKLIFLWFLFLLIVGLSFFTTHSVPKTLDSFSFYSFSFLIFWFFLKLPKKIFSKLDFLYSISIVSVVLLIIGLVMSLFRESALGVPGMNLIYSTYGHNHLGAVLILILPMTWWFYFEKKRNLVKKSNFYILLPLIFNIGLLLSFGRVVIFIGFLQLLYILNLTRQTSVFSFKKTKSTDKKVFKFLIFAFSILLLLKASLSIVPENKLSFICQNKFLPSKYLCKPIAKELRPFYWGQALSSVKDFPIFGYGAGSFSLISRKYAQLPNATSAHTHNAFLKTFAELGLLGGSMFLLLMFGMLFQAWLVVKKEDFDLDKKNIFSLKKAMFIGLVSIYFNVLFDFDWSFLGTFSLTLILLALIVKEGNGNLFKNKFLQLEKTLVLFLSGGLIILSLLFLDLEFLTRNNKIKEAFKLFPYFSAHKDVFRKEIKSDQDSYLEWKEIYKYTSGIVDYKFSYVENNSSLDPWSLLSEPQLKSLLEIKNYEELNSRLFKTYDLLENAQEKYGYDIGYSKKFNFFDYSLKTADFLMLRHRYDEAARHYVWVYQTEPWIFLFHEIPFPEKTRDFDKMDGFLRLFSQVDRDHWSNSHETLASLYKKQLIHEIETNDLDLIDFYLNYFVDHIGWDYQESLVVKAKLQWLANDLISIGDFENAEKILIIMAKKISPNDYWGADQLGNFYIYLAEKTDKSEEEKNQLIEKAKAEYLACRNTFEIKQNYCQYGLDFIKDGNYDSLQYGRTAKVILKRGGLIE